MSSSHRGSAASGVRVDSEMLVLRAQQELENRGITTQAAWNAFLDGLTDAQLATLLRAFFKTFIRVGPP